METTTLSTKGQIVLPKPIRDKYGWLAGQQLSIQENAESITITRNSGMPANELEKFAGCLKYHGETKSIQEMNEGITMAIRERYDRGRY